MEGSYAFDKPRWFLTHNATTASTGGKVLTAPPKGEQAIRRYCCHTKGRSPNLSLPHDVSLQIVYRLNDGGPTLSAVAHDHHMAKPLEPGDEIHCRRCHPVHFRPAPSETPDSARMMFWECRGKQYYAGHIGTESRHPTRTPGSARLQKTCAGVSAQN